MGSRFRGNDGVGFRIELTPDHPKNIISLNRPSTYVRLLECFSLRNLHATVHDDMFLRPPATSLSNLCMSLPASR
jgi:hypothetical protein